jgi:predicted DCC family thiol-disulfide oxidoreductase YuxK
VPPAEPTFLFDGDCAFCSSCARWIERHLPRQPHLLPWQFADLELLGVTAAECSAAVQWIDVDDRAAGADAIGRLLLFQRGPWRVAGRALLLPGVVPIARVVYRWVSRHRDRMPGGTPACKPGDPA